MKRLPFIIACVATLAFSLVCSRFSGCDTLRGVTHKEGDASFVTVTNGFHAPTLQEFPK